jgi:hypothetical protein
MKRTPLLLGAALCLTVPLARGQIYAYGFESLDAINPGWNAGSTYALSSTTGVTEGTYALEVTQGGGAFWDFGINPPDKMGFISAMIASGGILSVDVTSNSSDGNTGGWGQLRVAIQGGGITYKESATQNIWNSNRTTFEIDFSSVDFSTAKGDWLELQFAFNQTNGTKSYIDNLNIGGLAVIPEPSLLALMLGIGALAFPALRRRR